MKCPLRIKSKWGTSIFTTFAITLGIGYPALKEAWHTTGDPSTAIVQAYLTILARVPDTLIVRKRGGDMACQVSRWADEVLAVGGVFTAQGRKALAELDCALRDERHTLNPGTTADLTTAAIFLVLLYDMRSGPTGGNVQSVDGWYNRSQSGWAKPVGHIPLRA